MKKEFFLLLTITGLLIFSGCSKRSGNPRILVFSKTASFYHQSIPKGVAAIQKLGAENGFDVDTTTNAAYFNEDSLQNYSAVVFLSTTGALLNTTQRIAFERYIQAGGGFAGIHGASDAEYDWRWYTRLVGGQFLSHPRPQEAKLIVKDKTHPATKHLPDEWVRTDEWYDFKKFNDKVNVLITIDEKSYEGGLMGEHHPMAWYHDYDGGRAFYTELGHTDETYEEPLFLQHLLGGIEYAIGDNKKLNYAKATSQYPPDEDRFSKTTLVSGQFFEPVEMTVLPNLDILVAQRRGEILRYSNATGDLKQVGFLDVYFKTAYAKANAEEGLLGIAKDPDFEKNKWVYVFYSPFDTSVNRLSRFKFENDTIDNKTEQVILQFYEQREICCHTGGSIAFGPDGLLYVSTGDNSTPFNQPNQKYTNQGFAPLDDRPGFEQYDARRSSGNTNDLRGKILRIRVNEDGTYAIPENNLFAQGTDKTRPEIYVMGNRNPYRISVDQKNSFLYWGEVGPDANNDSLATRGPRGYDEVNQARKAGFFGWPLFVGNNYPYTEYDYNTGVSTGAFDPQKPLNNSRNNTGLRELPPVAPAFIWYPYGESQDFPQVGSGGRNAMAGPVYYADKYPKETRLPDYYNNKLFIYEWIRGWIKVVTTSPEGDFEKMEPFMAGSKFANPIDIEMGPDGRLYVLEYGSGWFSKNDNAGLLRIDYNGGNRPPKVGDITVSATSGALPLTVKATVEAMDPEKDALTYTWSTGSGETKETKEPEVEFVFDKAGDYNISVEVKDNKGAMAKSNAVPVYAGNTAPSVAVAIRGNQSFYFPGKAVAYEVSVNDKEDGTAIDPENLYVSADFLEGADKAAIPQGHQQTLAANNGKAIMATLDCQTCHKVNDKSIGPSFTDIAKKYHKQPDAISYLVDKIIKGGSGVWGEVAMAAHPDLSQEDARQIVQWTLTLAGDAKKSLPAQGSIPVKAVKENEALYIGAAYTDKGGTGSKPLSGAAGAVLLSSRLGLGSVANLDGYQAVSFGGRRLLLPPADKKGWFSIDSIDLQSVNGIELTFSWQDAKKPPLPGTVFELWLGGEDGTKLGEGIMQAAAGKNSSTLRIRFDAVSGTQPANLYIISTPKEASENRYALSGLELLSL